MEKNLYAGFGYQAIDFISYIQVLIFPFYSIVENFEFHFEPSGLVIHFNNNFLQSEGVVQQCNVS